MTQDGLDWQEPLNANGEARARALHEALGVPMSEVSALIDDLRAGVSCADWGFPQLAGIGDVEQRALVSDQLLSGADGIQDALVDAAISARDIDLHTGATGLPYPANDDSLNDMVRSQQLRRAVGGFFDATGTALDCLAAVLIVVARVPLSVQRADYGQLTALDPTKAHANVFDVPVPDRHRDLWLELLTELDEAAADGPADWLAWALAMRNALTHRGRVTDIFLPRRISRRLLVPPTNAPQRYYRYDLHLRRRPWLPGLEQILAGPGLPDSWLDEPAGRTVAGLRDALLRLCERLAAWARETWSRSEQPALVAPVQRWLLPPAPAIAFEGFNPGETTPITSAVGGINEQHLRLAERLRRRRSGLADLGAASGGPANES